MVLDGKDVDDYDIHPKEYMMVSSSIIKREGCLGREQKKCLHPGLNRGPPVYGIHPKEYMMVSSSIIKREGCLLGESKKKCLHPSEQGTFSLWHTPKRVYDGLIIHNKKDVFEGEKEVPPPGIERGP